MAAGTRFDLHGSESPLLAGHTILAVGTASRGVSHIIIVQNAQSSELSH
jgi:hypothetical protein